MKRLIAAAIIAVLLFSVCLTDYFYVKNSYNTLTENIDKCIAEIEQNDISNARFHAEKLEEEWKNRECILSIFINHSIIDEIDTAIIQLTPYIDTGNYDLFITQCAVIDLKLTQMREDSTVNLHSIL